MGTTFTTQPSIAKRLTKIILLGLVLVFAGCQKDEVEIDLSAPTRLDAEVALRWNEVFLELERFTPGYRPPVSARTSAYISLAAYEALIPGMADEYNSLQSHFTNLRVPTIEEGVEYHWPTVLTAVYSQSMEHFFPTAPAERLYRIYQLQDQLYAKYRQQTSQEVFNRSVVYGQEVADAVFRWSATDLVGHAAYLRNNDHTYRPPTGVGRWQPTYPDYLPALLPYWGKARTFVAGADDVAPDPLPYSEDPDSELYKQALEVRDMVNEIKAEGRAEDHWIAEFWSDDCPILTFTPAGRWVAVTNQLVERKDISLALAVEAYARVGMALADAGIRCWHEKYRFNYERPIDYIRRVQGDPHWNTVMCPDGSGNFFTPNFPAYPSGHASFGAAAAEVLTDLFGRDHSFIDRCHEGRQEFNGTPRNFNDFYQMAGENAYSRVPLGVHFRMDSEAGLELGYGIGRKVNRLPWRR